MLWPIAAFLLVQDASAERVEHVMRCVREAVPRAIALSHSTEALAWAIGPHCMRTYPAPRAICIMQGVQPMIWIRSRRVPNQAFPPCQSREYDRRNRVETAARQYAFRLIARGRGAR